MLKRTNFLTIVLLSSVSLVSAGTVQNPRIAIVRIPDIAQKSQKFAALQKNIEAEIKKRGAEIEALKNQFQQILEKLQNGGKDMKQSVIQDYQEKLASLKAQIEVKQQGLQAYAEREMHAAEESLVKDIQTACKKLDCCDIAFPGTLYVKESKNFDVTDQVIAEMDKSVSTALVKEDSKVAVKAKK